MEEEDDFDSDSEEVLKKRYPNLSIKEARAKKRRVDADEAQERRLQKKARIEKVTKQVKKQAKWKETRAIRQSERRLLQLAKEESKKVHTH